MSVDILTGDCRDVLKTLPDGSVHCVVTSPPYFGLRDYGVDGQIGLEESPSAFIDQMVAVFAEVRRALRDDGTLWLNLGDSYANDRKWRGSTSGKHVRALHGEAGIGRRRQNTGLKSKDMMGIPWRVAFALQDDGWYLRRDIIWHKLNPMPESVTDRPTTAHEYLFLLTKSPFYYYDAEAIMEPSSPNSHARAARGRSTTHKNADGGPGNQTITIKSPSAGRLIEPKRHGPNSLMAVDRVPVSKKTAGVTPKSAAPGGTIKSNTSFNAAVVDLVPMRNKRSVWSIASEAMPEAHFATFPPALVEPCILAGCPSGGSVLDPFGGAGTTGMVADRLGRDAILIELNPQYVAIARNRLIGDAGMFAQVTT